MSVALLCASVGVPQPPASKPGARGHTCGVRIIVGPGPRPGWARTSSPGSPAWQPSWPHLLPQEPGARARTSSLQPCAQGLDLGPCGSVS